MFDITFDLITQTACNSLVVFCFCNLIIVIILVGSKPASNFDQEGRIPLSVVTNRSTNDKQNTTIKAEHVCEEEVDDSSKVKNVNEFCAEKKCLGNYDNEGDNSEADRDDNEMEDDDELRRRVEEFIEKVNRGWKAELLKTPQLFSI